MTLTARFTLSDSQEGGQPNYSTTIEISACPSPDDLLEQLDRIRQMICLRYGKAFSIGLVIENDGEAERRLANLLEVLQTDSVSTDDSVLLESQINRALAQIVAGSMDQVAEEN